MSETRFSFTVDEFKVFHSIDRALYSLLVDALFRDPLESIQIVALWLWLERKGCRNFIRKILSLPHMLINELADEAVTCLKFIMDPHFVIPAERCVIPLTCSLVRGEMPLQFLRQNIAYTMDGISKVVNLVCLRAFSDIMQTAMKRNAAATMVRSQMMAAPAADQSFFQNPPHLVFLGESSNTSSASTSRTPASTQSQQGPYQFSRFK